MTSKKGILQKFSLASGIVSFVLAIIAAVMLYFRLENTDMYNPISASLLASIFFFIFVGFILTVIGKADIPSFKFDNTEEK